MQLDSRDSGPIWTIIDILRVGSCSIVDVKNEHVLKVEGYYTSVNQFKFKFKTSIYN